MNVVAAIGGAIKATLDAGAEATDLSDAPEEIKERILENAQLLAERDEQSAGPGPQPLHGLEYYSNEELLEEISRRMVVNG